MATREECSFHLLEPVVAPSLCRTREICFEDRSTSAKLQEVILNVVVVWIAAAKGGVMAMTFNNAKQNNSPPRTLTGLHPVGMPFAVRGAEGLETKQASTFMHEQGTKLVLLA
eukprot:4281507-Pleurochrysis_carterae.AAC.1